MAKSDKKTDAGPRPVDVLHQFVATAKAKLEPGVWDYVMGGAETADESATASATPK